MKTIAIENFYDQRVDFPERLDGWYLDVDRQHFRLSDKPFPGQTGTRSFYLANPSETPLHQYDRQQLFLIWFAPSISPISYLVWARSFEQALEIAAEEAASMHFRGVFTDEPPSEADEAGLTYTEAGWILSQEWGGGDVTDESLRSAALAVGQIYLDHDRTVMRGPEKPWTPPGHTPNAKQGSNVAGAEYAIRYAAARAVPASCAARHEIAAHAAKLGNLRGDAARTFTTAALAEWERVEPAVGEPPRAASRGGSPKSRMLREFDRLFEAGGSRSYVSLADLREALSGMSRAEFDETLNELRRDWVLTLSPAEGLHETVPRRVIDAGITDGRQNLVYVLRRESSQNDGDEDDESSDYERVVQAFDRLSKKQQSPYVIIADVVDESGLSIPRAHAVIRELIQRREGQTFLGEPSRATERQLAASFETKRGGHRHDREMLMTVFERHTPNARGGAFDEQAARELELYIENEYDLVGAPTSQGKAIEKNLKRKIKQGKFDYERSIDAWAHLIESGAKSYAKEFGGTWHEMFSPATRRFVAERWAQHFADENQLRQNGGDRLRAGEEAFRLKPGYGDQWASSPERAWEGVFVTETLSRGAQGFGVSMGERVLFDRQVRVVRVAGRFYAQPIADEHQLRQNGGSVQEFKSGSGPYTVYFETGSMGAGDKVIYKIKRASLAAAKTEALQQWRIRNTAITVLKNGIEVWSTDRP